MISQVFSVMVCSRYLLRYDCISEYTVVIIYNPISSKSGEVYKNYCQRKFFGAYAMPCWLLKPNKTAIYYEYFSGYGLSLQSWS
jgi:hypothetical protein